MFWTTVWSLTFKKATGIKKKKKIRVNKFLIIKKKNPYISLVRCYHSVKLAVQTHTCTKKTGFITNKLCDLGQSSLMPLGFSFSICKIAGFYLPKWSQRTLQAPKKKGKKKYWHKILSSCSSPLST